MRVRKIHDLQDIRAPELAEPSCLHDSLRSRITVSRSLRVRQSANLASRVRAQRHARAGLSGRP